MTAKVRCKLILMAIWQGHFLWVSLRNLRYGSGTKSRCCMTPNRCKKPALRRLKKNRYWVHLWLTLDYKWPFKKAQIAIKIDNLQLMRNVKPPQKIKLSWTHNNLHWSKQMMIWIRTKHSRSQRSAKSSSLMTEESSSNNSQDMYNPSLSLISNRRNSPAKEYIRRNSMKSWPYDRPLTNIKRSVWLTFHLIFPRIRPRKCRMHQPQKTLLSSILPHRKCPWARSTMISSQSLK